MSPSFMIHSAAASVLGFRYLWAKHVTGFDPRVHCARCLVGPYENRFGLRAPVNDMVPLDGYEPGAVIYFCGVSTPYRWENNAHLAVRVTGNPEDTASLPLYTGDEVTVAGAVAVPFTGQPAATLFPFRSDAFLTCRNFQFGAAAAAAGLIRTEAPPVAERAAALS